MEKDLKSLILSIRGRPGSQMVMDLIAGNERMLKQLTELLVSGDPLLLQRGVWPLYLLSEKYPEKLSPYLSRLVKLLDEPHHHPAVYRNITGLLQYTVIRPSQEGRIMNTCFSLLASPATAVAAKVNCLTVLKRLSVKHPEILPELKLLTRELYDQQPVSFRARARKEKLI